MRLFASIWSKLDYIFPIFCFFFLTSKVVFDVITNFHLLKLEITSDEQTNINRVLPNRKKPDYQNSTLSFTWIHFASLCPELATNMPLTGLYLWIEWFPFSFNFPISWLKLKFYLNQKVWTCVHWTFTGRFIRDLFKI